MYKLLRTLLKLTVLIVLILLIILAIKVPFVWAFDLFLIVYLCRKRRGNYWSHGSARWADLKDVEGMYE